MNQQDKVVAITVTYNRTRTLKKCLSALLAQSRPVDRIIIVDNNSNETEKAELLKLIENEQKLQLLSLPENLGGAGGFEAGMREAKKENPDWYWLMDDDAYPRRDCLEQLLKHAENLEDAGGVCPAIYGVDLQKYQMFHHKKISKLILRNIPVEKEYKNLAEVTEIEANAFVGPLFPGKVVDEVGIADKSLFIYGDDTEYTYRVSRKHKLFLIKDAVIDHQDAPVTNENMKPDGWWKEYYCYRNQYFMIREFHEQIWMRYLAYTALTMRLCAIIVKSTLLKIHVLRAILITKAMRDGILNKRGKTLDPQTYFTYLKRKGIIGS